MREVKALVRLCVYSGTCEPLLLADLISTKICASPFRVLYRQLCVEFKDFSRTSKRLNYGFQEQVDEKY